jgi:hypothetical protein
MIPQPFVKGATERVFFNRYEYVPGADIIFDFGNSTCTSAFNSSRIVYNVGTANVTGSLIAYNNPGPFYPTLESTNGGTMVTRAFAFGTNYLQWDYSSSVNQTSISIFKLNGTQLNPWSSFIPASPTSGGGSDIQMRVYGNTVVTGSATLEVSYIATTPTLDVDVSNGRNGYNLIATEANASTTHNLYINQTLNSTDSTSVSRANAVANGVRFGYNSNMRIIAFLQYPFILTPKQIRQTYKVFSQSFNA